MSVSVVPALIAELVDRAQEAVGAQYQNSVVADGFDRTERPADLMLLIGVEDQEFFGSAGEAAAQTEQEYAYAGARERWESGHITCVVNSWQSGSAGAQAKARETAYAVVEIVASIARGYAPYAPPLGQNIEGFEWADFGTRTRLLQGDSEGGDVFAAVVFDIGFRSLI